MPGCTPTPSSLPPSGASFWIASNAGLAAAEVVGRDRRLRHRGVLQRRVDEDDLDALGLGLRDRRLHRETSVGAMIRASGLLAMTGLHDRCLQRRVELLSALRRDRGTGGLRLDSIPHCIVM
jgi:hypothetical protein